MAVTYLIRFAVRPPSTRAPSAAFFSMSAPVATPPAPRYPSVSSGRPPG